MNRRRIVIGPGAASLILVLIVLCMSTLGVLALMDARTDLAISRRSVQVAGEVYALNEQAEASLAVLDGIAARCAVEHRDRTDWLSAVAQELPAGMTIAGATVAWEEKLGARTLRCAAELAVPGEGPRVRWVRHELWTDTEEMGAADPWN